MALALKVLWRASFDFSTSANLLSGTWATTPVGTAAGAVYPYPAIYNVGPTKAVLIKSIVLTNVTASQDLTIAGIYTGVRSVAPANLADLTSNPTNGVCSFQRIAPPNLRIPFGQQVVLDTELVMMGVTLVGGTPSPSAATNDWLVFISGALGSGTVSKGIECVVNGAERDQV